MKGDLLVVDSKGLAFTRRENVDVVRQLQATSHLAVGIVVSVQQVDRYSCVSESAHLANEEQPRIEVPPVPVVDVTGNHNEIYLFVDGLGDQFVESVPCRSAQALSRRIGIRSKAS